MWLGIGVKIVNWWRSLAANGPFSNHATLTNGLVSYWKLDEQSGVRYDSITASANDLTDNNTVTSVNAGPSGVVAQFTAANIESLTCANLLGADVDAFVSVWAKVDAYGGTRTIWSSASGNFQLRHTDSTTFQLFVRGYSANVQTAATAGLNQWYHLVAYHDSSADQIGIYMDGVLTTAASGGANSAGTATRIGGREDDLSMFDGKIARLGFWSGRVPDAPTATSLFNSGNGKSYSDLTTAEKVGLVSYWNLDEVSGNRADSHGSNTLTDNNTVTSVTNSVPPPKNIAAQFTAANLESLTHVDNASLRVGTSDFTFAFWYQRTLDPAALTSPLAKGGQEEYTFDTNPNAFLGMRFYTKNGGGYPIAEWGSALTLNQWYLVIGWRDGTAQTVNIQISNGTPISAATGAIVSADNTGIFALGKLGGGGNYITGLLDEVGFWSRVLTAQERTDLYNSGAGLFY